ncbi:SpoIIE family protein phosphatase [Actinoplanes sp. NPDC051851]|uniref:SpoIIE family protein phosphatase n=1 Tax=Actinoplanes sp. NPDC051851 TaxID=3154753 RepID=UPI00342B0281
MNLPEAGDLEAMTAAVDQLPFIVLVCEGPDLVMTACNAATRATLSGRGLLGKPIREVLEDLSGQQFVGAFYEVYRTGEPFTARSWRAHMDRPDGSLHEMFATFTLVPWRDGDGGIRGVIAGAFDVTELARDRQAAEAEAARMRHRYEQSREVITELQRELLPAGVPVLPGLQVAASYLLADADTAAGGDWFDAIARPDGTVALVVGDVVGHGITASGVMGQLRAVLHERLDAGATIGEALAAADRFAARRGPAHATTVCVALLGPATGEIEYCTAGHPPPLLIGAGTRYLPPTGAAPLGTGTAFPVRRERLEHGELVLLYSDGILERPGAEPDAAAELAEVAADVAAGRAFRAGPAETVTERLCGQTIELLVRAGGHADDITLLAAQRVPVVPELALDLDAEPAALRGARVGLGDWLAALGAAEHDVFVLQHALGELATNAVEHAFGGVFGKDVIEVRAALTPDGCVTASVKDHGGWRTPERQTVRGRGLALTAQLVRNLRVEPGANGTLATVRHPLTRPARLLTSLESAPATLPAPGALTITELPGGDETRIRLDGPVDVASAATVLQDLLRRSRGGTVPMTADLTGVTHLASAGVSALFQAAGHHRDPRAPLTLVAAPGSAAREILGLVGLPVTP